MGKNLEKIIRVFLFFGGCYFIFDGLLHFLGIKLASVSSAWPESATNYANLINHIYASFVFLAALISFIIQKDLKKYKALVIGSAVWASFHGLVLLYLAWTQNYQQVFKSLPSLLVWLPFYKEYLTFNAILLLAYSGIVYIWSRSEKSGSF